MIDPVTPTPSENVKDTNETPSTPPPQPSTTVEQENSDKANVDIALFEQDTANGITELVKHNKDTADAADAESNDAEATSSSDHPIIINSTATATANKKNKVVTVTSTATHVPQSNEQQGQYSIISCIRCRERKVKCTRENPSCVVCLGRSEECIYPATKRTKSTIKKTAHNSLKRQQQNNNKKTVLINNPNHNFLLEPVVKNNNNSQGNEEEEDDDNNTTSLAAAAIAASSQNQLSGESEKARIRKTNRLKYLKNKSPGDSLLYLVNLDLETNYNKTPNFIVVDSFKSLSNNDDQSNNADILDDYENPFAIKRSKSQDTASNQIISKQMLEKLKISEHEEITGMDQLKYFKEFISKKTFRNYLLINDYENDCNIILFKYCLNTNNFQLFDELMFELRDYDLVHWNIFKILSKYAFIIHLISQKNVDSASVLKSHALLQSIYNELCLISKKENSLVVEFQFELKKIWEFFAVVDFVVSKMLLNNNMISNVPKTPLDTINMVDYFTVLKKIPFPLKETTNSLFSTQEMEKIISLDITIDNMLSNSPIPIFNKLVLLMSKIYLILPASFNNIYCNISLQKTIQFFFHFLINNPSILSTDISSSPSPYSFTFPALAQVFQAITLFFSFQLLSVTGNKDVVKFKTSLINDLDLLSSVLENIPSISALPTYLYKPLKFLTDCFIPLLETTAEGDEEEEDKAMNDQIDTELSGNEDGATKDSGNTTQSIIDKLEKDEDFKKVVIHLSQRPLEFWESLSF